MESNLVYLLSINEKSANALFEGNKHYEFRRKFEKYESPARIFLYVTSPKKMIVGEVSCNPPIRGSIDEICGLLTHDSFDTEEKLRAYLRGVAEAYALPVVSKRKFKRGISLDEMRQKFGKFSPPISYLRLYTPKYKKVREFLEAQEYDNS